MKLLFALVLSVVTTAAVAHPSLAPHTHPHGVSILPGLDTLGVAALVVLGLLALRKLLRS